MSETNEVKASDEVADRLDGVVMREEHDKYRDKTIKKAANGVCEGNCGEHEGAIQCVRVFGKDGYDWGYFSYCETARTTDRDNGMSLIYIGA